MAESGFGQPPRNEPEQKDYLDNLHEIVFGQLNVGGSLDGKNITNITDPGDTTDVSDLATRFNALLAQLRILGIM